MAAAHGRVAAVAAAGWWRWRPVVVAAAADVAPTSRSSTTSPCSVTSTTALGYYRFSYNGSDKAYVGVMAQEVQVVAPDAVIRGHDGYLRVFYDKLGLQFQTYDQWLATGARIPSAAPQPH